MPNPAILLITRDPEIESAVCEAACRTRSSLRIARTTINAVGEIAHGFDGIRLILLDLDTRIHGVTLFSALDDCHGAAPVVVITDCEEAYMAPLALSHGAAACIGKPATPARFRRLFEQYASAPASLSPDL